MQQAFKKCQNRAILVFFKVEETQIKQDEPRVCIFDIPRLKGAWIDISILGFFFHTN